MVSPDLGEIYHLFCQVINAPTSTPILEYKTSRNLKKYMVFSFVRSERAYKGSQAGIQKKLADSSKFLSAIGDSAYSIAQLNPF